MAVSPKTLVFLFGPPAVGKMTVGRALEALSGLPLLHNHMTIDLVLPFFGFDSPAFHRLVRTFREHLISEVAAGDGPGMIFTFVWAFDQPSDLEFVMSVKDLFAKHGGRIAFVELWTDLETRMARNEMADRLA